MLADMFDCLQTHPRCPPKTMHPSTHAPCSYVAQVRLQCVVPYLVTLLGDAAAGVRSMALRCLVRVMCSIRVIPPSDSKVFQDYLIPSLSLLPNDVEEAVRVEYAQGECERCPVGLLCQQEYQPVVSEHSVVDS